MNFPRTQLRLQLAVLLVLFSAELLTAQLQTFQKVYQTDKRTFCYDVAPTPDFGYIMTGLEEDPNMTSLPQTPYLTKLDCNGEVEWTKKFGEWSPANAQEARVTVLNSGDYVMMSTIISDDFDIMMVRIDPTGDVIWQKTYGGSNRDIGRGLVRLSGDDLLVVGHTNSYGTDLGLIQDDMYLLKIDGATGDTIWTKTFGNLGSTDYAISAVELLDGGLAITGVTSALASNWITLVRTDADGNILWNKLYGKVNRSSFGWDIALMPDGGYVLTGQSNLANPITDPEGDLAVVRTDDQGLIVWAKTYHGTSPDFAEIGRSVLVTGDTLAILFQTTSYASTSTDPGKRVLLLADANNGDLLRAKYFNESGSYLPMLRKDNRGYIITGNTQDLAQSFIDPILVKLNDDFESGCNENDVTAATVVEDPVWETEDVVYQTDNGSVVNDYTEVSNDSIFTVETLCEEPYLLTTSFSVEDSLCANDPVTFTSEISPFYYKSITWDFGDGNTISNLTSPDHTYEVSGTYDVTLTVEFCSDTVVATETISVEECPEFIDFTCEVMPNVFTPNSDGTNDNFGPVGNFELNELEFSIFNRWGERVHHTTDLMNYNWDGMIDGEPANSDVFVYWIQVVKTTGETVTCKSDVTLLR